MLRLEIPDDVLVKAVTDAVERQKPRRTVGALMTFLFARYAA
jgi:hypothetical protein